MSQGHDHEEHRMAHLIARVPVTRDGVDGYIAQCEICTWDSDFLETEAEVDEAIQAHVKGET